MLKNARVWAAGVAVSAIAGALVLAPASMSAKRASAPQQVNCGATTLELLGINPGELVGDPCRPASSGLEIPLGGGNHVYVLRGTLEGTSAPAGAGGTSDASLLDLRLLSDELPVQLLRSSVYVSCQAGKPAVSGGSSTVSGLDAPMLSPVRIDEPLSIGSLIFVNERVATATGMTTRAVRVATPAGDVILSEASGGYSGNPCKKKRRR